jgi:branched-chain amino acid transport system substrate-binding protein
LHRRATGGGIAASLVAVTAVTLCASLASAPAVAKDIKVCLIAGKTGPLEAYAKQTENGFMLGLEYLTKNTMKVGDDKLEILVKDDQLKPDRGKSLLEECYSDDKADIAVGTTGSPIALAMLPVAEEKKKVLIVRPAVADSITGDKWNPSSSRTTAALAGRAGGAAHAGKRRSPRHARLDTPSADSVTAFKRRCPASG